MKRSWLKRKLPLKEKSDNSTAACKLGSRLADTALEPLHVAAVLQDDNCVGRHLGNLAASPRGQSQKPAFRRSSAGQPFGARVGLDSLDFAANLGRDERVARLGHSAAGPLSAIGAGELIVIATADQPVAFVALGIEGSHAAGFGIC
jgi:hypothetical protein